MALGETPDFAGGIEYVEKVNPELLVVVTEVLRVVCSAPIPVLAEHPSLDNNRRAGRGVVLGGITTNDDTNLTSYVAQLVVITHNDLILLRIRLFY